MEEAEPLEVPPAELVDIKRLSVDHKNPNRMSTRQFQALKKSIRRWGFTVPIVTNRDYLIADGEHRLEPGDFNKARLINEEIARISTVVIHPKFRGVGLGAYLVRETMPKVEAKVIETLAVMARYNPFFEKAGMMRVDYKRDHTSIEKKIRAFLENRDFDFDFLRSETYCRSFFSQLNDQDKKILLNHLSEFSSQPFIKVDRVEPGLLTKVSSSDCIYLYSINSAKVE